MKKRTVRKQQKGPVPSNPMRRGMPLPQIPSSMSDDMYVDTIYAEDYEDYEDMYETVGKAGSQVVSDEAAKPSKGSVLITSSKVQETALDDLKKTPMPRGNVKRLRDHWVKKQDA